MSSQAYADRLSRSLESTGLVQPVQATYADNRVNVLCRLQPGNEQRWTEIIKRVLVACEQEKTEIHAWQTHICRNYFLKGTNLVFGWNVSVQSREMARTLDVLSRVVRGEPVRENGSSLELDEFPLQGGNDRNAPNPKGKGVHTIGKNDFHPARSSNK